MSAHKVMATVFWNAEGILLVDYLELGSTVTGTYRTELIAKSLGSTDEEDTKKVASWGDVLSWQCKLSNGCPEDQDQFF